MRTSHRPARAGIVLAAFLWLLGCREDELELSTTAETLTATTSAATDVAILSRGGGNGETERSDAELGCWTLTGTGGYTSEPLVKFASLGVPAGARVTSATLRLTFDNWNQGFTVRGRYLAAAWSGAATGGLGWLNRSTGAAWAQPGARGEGTDLVAGRSFALTSWTGSGADVQTIALDVAVVQAWVDNPSSNQGVLLINETPNAPTRLFSSRHGTVARRPTLEIQYTVDSGPDAAPRPIDGAVVDGATPDARPIDARTIDARPVDAAGAVDAAPPAGNPITVTFVEGSGGYASTRGVGILSRGGGNGEADKTGTQLGCWNLTGTSGYTNQPLLKFEHLGLPAGARVTSASLRLVFANWAQGFTVRGYYLATPWNHAAADLGWLNRDTGAAWAQAGARGQGTDLVANKSFALTGWAGTGADVKTIALDPAVVQAWVDHPAANQGVLLVNETSNVVTRLHSPRAAAAHRPVLAITYVTGSGGGDTTPPAVALTAPGAGAQLTASITLAASASDNVGVAGVQYLIDGSPIGGEQPAGGTLTVDTTILSNGSHTFAARARDAAGNSATSAAIAATVTNAPGLDARVSNPTCRPPPRSAPPTSGTLGLQPVFPSLSTGSGGPFGNNAPVVARRVLMPGGERLWFLGLRSGRVFQVNDPGASSPPSTNLLDPYVSPSRDLSIGEDGFLGLAFDPAIATDPQRAYVYYVRGGYGSLGLYRATVSRNASGIYVTSNPVMLLSAGAGGHHYGGDVQFGPDGYLYLSVGEDDIGARVRSPNNLRGKVLRIDVHAATPLPGKLYGIPADNPHRLNASGQPNAACHELGDSQLPDTNHACPEIYALGFRNPFRFSFDRQGGALWLGDVGATHEEIDLVTRGGDYGWNTQEGPTASAGITPAVAGLPREGATCAGYAVMGGFVYRGAAIPWLVGTYLAADNGTGKIHALAQPYASNRSLSVALGASCAQFNPASFAEDEHGELYVVALNPGAGLGLFKIVPATTPVPGDGPPSALSATGCVQAGNPSQPIAAAVPYGVNAELWSDGLAKRRWMVLPDGATIAASGDGDWTFPIGTVLLKEFSAGSRRIETRFLVRHTDGDWTGYTYVWNAAQTDATLSTAGQAVDLGDGGPPWTVPAASDCLSCHTTAKGRALGPETRQMNLAFVYPNGRRANQLATLAHLGLIDAAYANPRASGAFPRPNDPSQPAATRARSYLHANCSHCHPGPGSNPNLAFDTPLASANVCNVTPATPVPGATRLIVPGNAAQSGLNLRMKHLGSLRMPRLGSSRVDTAGTALVDAWVTGLTGCAP